MTPTNKRKRVKLDTMFCNLMACLKRNYTTSLSNKGHSALLLLCQVSRFVMWLSHKTLVLSHISAISKNVFVIIKVGRGFSRRAASTLTYANRNKDTVDMFGKGHASQPKRDERTLVVGLYIARHSKCSLRWGRRQLLHWQRKPQVVSRVHKNLIPRDNRIAPREESLINSIAQPQPLALGFCAA